MWQVALRDALKAERSARYKAFLSPMSCWPRCTAPGPALLKELAALTLSSKLDKWNVIQLWRRPKEAVEQHTTLNTTSLKTRPRRFRRYAGVLETGGCANQGYQKLSSNRSTLTSQTEPAASDCNSCPKATKSIFQQLLFNPYKQKCKGGRG